MRSMLRSPAAGGAAPGDVNDSRYASDTRWPLKPGSISRDQDQQQPRRRRSNAEEVDDPIEAIRQMAIDALASAGGFQVQPFGPAIEQAGLKRGRRCRSSCSDPVFAAKTHCRKRL